MLENKKLDEIRLLYKRFDKELSKDYKEINVFSEKALNISIQIIEEIDKIFDWRKNNANISEDYKIKLISRLQWIYDIKDLNILSVDELLEKIINKVEDILSFNVIDLWYDIFPASEEIKIFEGKDEENKFETEKISVDKFWILVKVLLEKNINLDDIVIYEEKLNKDRMREKPYKLIYLRTNWVNKTIVISDEIGQATFIYDWLINLELFNKNSKWDEIDWVIWSKIVYGKDYYNNLSTSIFLKQNNNKWSNSIDAGNYIDIDNDIIKKEWLKTILWYKAELEWIEEELKEEANIYKVNWKWYFWDAKWTQCFPKINWKKLISFPSSWFNKIYWLGDMGGEISSIKNLKKLFIFLWMGVINDEREMYKLHLEWIEEELKEEVNIYKIDWKWYFWDAKWTQCFPKINWKKLISFPSTTFNKINWLGNKEGQISSINHLKNLFIFLKMDVINDEREVYKLHLEWIEEKLKEEANIYKIDWKWFFWNAKWVGYWPKINWKSLMTFPDTWFNIKAWLWSNVWVLWNIKYLKELFIFLWMEVTDNIKKQY